MGNTLTELDAHEQPSDEMRADWKGLSRQDHIQVVKDPRIDDPRAPLENSGFRIASILPQSQIADSFRTLGPEFASEAKADAQILYHPILPGLLILPSLVPPVIQETLLDRMIHRDLSEPRHQTNLHLHYDLPYPEAREDDHYSGSFFSLDPNSPPSFHPKDPEVHKPITINRVMQRRLHWVTFGGQYDWTNRIYPDDRPLQFPKDLSDFLETLFPETLAQAAILNFYSPGDTMMMHRDVSEETDKGLISISFGCDGLFMIAPDEISEQTPSQDGSEKKYLVLRLRSGDAIYMTKESRYAWHGVPKVLKGTCPGYLADWPAKDGKFEEWRGWMQTKRINFNVRQMKD